MDGKKDWEWFEEIESRIKMIPSPEEVKKNYEAVTGTGLLFEIQGDTQFNKDRKGLFKLLACIRTLREALEFYANRSNWELDSGIWNLSELDCEAGMANEQPGMTARAALEKAAKGVFE